MNDIKSNKYPRTPHLPWSPGGTNDDKRITNVDGLIGELIVITEKCDGSNLALTRDAVFARSHSSTPTHASFNFAKSKHAEIAFEIPEGITIFCEYCYAVHSIKYNKLPGYLLVFGVRDDVNSYWWSWDNVCLMAKKLTLPTVPELFSGKLNNENELKDMVENLSKEKSLIGGDFLEGVVVRIFNNFLDNEFSTKIAKWVRAGHVTTDVHWKHQKIVKQIIF
jgi:hypothetical protein